MKTLECPFINEPLIMKRTLLLLVLLAITPLSTLANKPVAHLSGTVRSVTDTPFHLAHVHLLPRQPYYASPLFGTIIDSATIAADGSWQLTVAKQGYYDLVFTAVDHQWVRVPLPIDGSESDIAVDLRLPLLDWRECSAMRAIGISDSLVPIGFSLATGSNDGLYFRPTSDGKWRVEIESDESEVALQVFDIVTTGRLRWGDRTVNLPLVGNESREGLRFRYDGRGDYLAILSVTDGRVVATIDFDALEHLYMGIENDPGDVATRPAIFTEVRDLAERLEHEDQDLEESIAKLYKSLPDRAAARTAAVEMVREAAEQRHDEMQAIMQSDRHAMLRRLAAVQLAYIEYDYKAERYDWERPDSLVQRAILGVVPIASPWWEENPFIGMWLIRQQNGDRLDEEELTKGVWGQARSTGLRGVALATLVARADGRTVGSGGPVNYSRRWRPMMMTDGGSLDSVKVDPARFAELFALLAEEYRADLRFSRFIDELDPSRAMMPGKIMPAFGFSRYSEGETEMIDPESLRGQWYLLDFWATWCGPCVGDQPHLQEAWERFGGDNFRIVSVSFDVSWADVERFRKERYAMPWDHTYLTGKDSDEAWQMFDIDGIPRVVLVDPEGRIVRVDHGLRGAGLVKTLAEIIGE